MKRTGLIALAIFYFLINTSFVLNLHYCGEFLSEIAFIVDADNCCCEEEGKAISQCCEESSISLDFDNDDHLNEYESFKKKSVVVGTAIPNFSQLEYIPIQCKIISSGAPNAPPSKKLKPYILYHQFKIFA